MFYIIQTTDPAYTPFLAWNLQQFARHHCNFSFEPYDYYIGKDVDRFVCFLQDEYQNTISVLIAIYIPYPQPLVEIYSFCTDSSQRGKGYGKRLLTHVIEYFIKAVQYARQTLPMIYIGFEITNARVSKLYSQLFFSNPVLSAISPGGFHAGKTVIWLIIDYDGNEKTIKKTIHQIENILLTYSKKKYYIATHNFLELEPVLTKNREYGFYLLPTEKDKNRLQLNKEHFAEGLGAPEYTVQFAVLTDFTIHTHPIDAMVDYRMGLGWPSSCDMLFVFSNYKQIKFHFVIAVEGVYSIHLTPECLQFLHLVQFLQPLLINDVGQWILQHFQLAELEREVMRMDEKEGKIIRSLLPFNKNIIHNYQWGQYSTKKQYTIMKFLNYVKYLTFEKLAKEIENTFIAEWAKQMDTEQVSLFIVDLYTWDFLKTTDEIIVYYSRNKE